MTDKDTRVALMDVLQKMVSSKLEDALGPHHLALCLKQMAPFAAIALGAYAAACEETHPKLARDLIEEWGALAMDPKSDPIALWAEIHRVSTLLRRANIERAAFPILKALHSELNTLRWMSVVKDDPWDQAIDAVRKRIAQIIETEGK